MKKILFTNLQLCDFAGSEINILTLASYFKELGWDVEITAFVFGNPIKAKLESAGLPFFHSTSDALNNKVYDLIWSQHSIVLDYLLFEKKITASKIIYSSLSPKEPYEVPPVYGNRLSLILANSEETRDGLLDEGIHADLCTVMPNFVTDSMLHGGGERLKSCRNSISPKKVAIVSNHICSEVDKAAKKLRSKHIKVDYFGKGHRTVLVDEALLTKYDLVVTIGKTVQYCFAMAIPVFCYDRFGGPGYIREDHLEKAAYFNFSGRGFSKASAEELVHSIVDGYAAARDRLPMLYEYAFRNCRLSILVDNVLELTKTSGSPDFGALVKDYWIVKRQAGAVVRLFLNQVRIKHSTFWKLTVPARKFLKLIQIAQKGR